MAIFMKMKAPNTVSVIFMEIDMQKHKGLTG